MGLGIERVLRWFVGLTIIGVVSCGPSGALPTPVHQPAPSPQPRAAADEVVASAPTAGSRLLESFAAGPYTYEVVIERLGRTEEAQRPYVHDPFSVRLLRGQQTLGQVRVSETSCGIDSLAAGKLVRGADSESKTWTTDGEHCDIGTSARTVALSEHDTGLLVTHHAGFEYRYSYHYLYLARGDQLLTVWKYEEDTLGAQRTRTSVIAGTAPGRQDIAFMHIQRDELGFATRLTATRLHLDSARVEMLESALPDGHNSLQVLVIGDYRNKSAALKVDLQCVRQLDLLKSSFTPGLQTPRLYFGGIFARRNDAEASVPDPTECSTFQEPKFLEYRSTSGGVHAKAQ